MKRISYEEFSERLKHGEKIFNDLIFEDMDLNKFNLSNLDFSSSNFINVDFSNVDFTNSILEDCLLDDCNLQSAIFINSNIKRASMRRVNLQNANIKGAKLYAAVLEGANLENIIFDEKTEYFSLYCPEEGAFIAYKKGLNNRIIKLLIPGDAKRVSSTRNCCRCDKVKVLEIKNFDGTSFYEEAWSTVAEDFCYKLGEWVYAGNFNEERWYDSTGGIHFWMTEEEARKY